MCIPNAQLSQLDLINFLCVLSILWSWHLAIEGVLGQLNVEISGRRDFQELGEVESKAGGRSPASTSASSLSIILSSVTIHCDFFSHRHHHHYHNISPEKQSGKKINCHPPTTSHLSHVEMDKKWMKQFPCIKNSPPPIKISCGGNS